MTNPWFTLFLSSVEVHQVMWLRGVKMMQGGPAASREATRMVSEKFEAGMEAAGRMAFGATPDSIMLGYRRKVRANRRRLLAAKRK